MSQLSLFFKATGYIFTLTLVALFPDFFFNVSFLLSYNAHAGQYTNNLCTPSLGEHSQKDISSIPEAFFCWLEEGTSFCVITALFPLPTVLSDPGVESRAWLELWPSANAHVRGWGWGLTCLCGWNTRKSPLPLTPPRTCCFHTTKKGLWRKLLIFSFWEEKQSL